MKHAIVLVEGQTEYNFVSEVMQPYLLNSNVFLTPRLTTTNRQKRARGGIASYGNIKYDLQGLLHSSHFALVTTMFDFYALKRDFPGFTTLLPGTPYQRVNHLITAFEQDIHDSRFLAYLSLHEFEALLFADPDRIAARFENQKLKELVEIIENYGSPEEINEGRPPSKHLLELYPKYEKTIDGYSIASKIGLDHIRQACSHFNDWLTKLENLGKNDG